MQIEDQNNHTNMFLRENKGWWKKEMEGRDREVGIKRDWNQITSMVAVLFELYFCTVIFFSVCVREADIFLWNTRRRFPLSSFLLSPLSLSENSHKRVNNNMVVVWIAEHDSSHVFRTITPATCWCTHTLAHLYTSTRTNSKMDTIQTATDTSVTSSLKKPSSFTCMRGQVNEGIEVGRG